ncbi:DNA polymerase III, subunit gamma and tau [Candidatus Roizmanbacteria bacterium RIFCSPHIGHO2_01_FULL_39_12b]|uniref:DNA polymerase III subunit gamma/tau n=1 Tax=Candidatus Roizmanbacteria bacterium RIFCSPHIGHO2_01_FULL_39_12b TaxID=1802030 RepID=A0A1F7G883_9BACT|nr:MAG: DNA polymerase III, subunit gamma and tau [Candidatus Roizmanbacteria bacterium RIFCSPHIGHO2_01_FULL_39_12b]
MLYLRYRPQTIAEIDNSSVKNRLLSIIASSELPHAFLLVGPKGTGKTSTARIIAKSINCEKNKRGSKGKDFEPCNDCDSCKAITAGMSIDVVEIDGASNRRIDDIRELNSNVKFIPVSSRYKVYIIDEVHMLTTEAFNALLKTLEEPPSHVVFILATTEAHKLPKTIISRCVTVTFSKATRADLVSSLERVCIGEKVVVDKQVLTLIAKHADFAFRDAHKLLEEFLTSGITTLDGAKTYFGLTLAESDLLSLIEKGEIRQIFELLENFEDKGGSFKSLIESLLNTLHLLLLKNKGVEKEDNQDLDYAFTLSQIVLLMRLFQNAYRDLKFAPIEALPLEIALVEYFAKQE